MQSRIPKIIFQRIKPVFGTEGEDKVWRKKSMQGIPRKRGFFKKISSMGFDIQIVAHKLPFKNEAL